MDQTADGGSGDVVLFRNFGQTDSRTTVCNNRTSVDVEWRSTDSPTFQFRSPHAGSNSLDDKTFFQFGNRTDNHDYRPAERASCVDIFPETDELDFEVAQFIEHFQEMAGTSCDSIERSNEHDIEAMPSSICQQLVESRSLCSQN